MMLTYFYFFYKKKDEKIVWLTKDKKTIHNINKITKNYIYYTKNKKKKGIF
jgi:hypothetical protein